MNRYIFLVVSLTAFIFGCAQPQPSSPVPAPAMTGIQNCAPSPPLGNCQENARNKIFIHFTGNGELKVSPPNMCADKNGEITVHITPNGNTIRVYAVPEDASNGWILASNSPNLNEMKMSVPDEEGVFKYYIFTEDGQCIDPRIHVD